MKRQRRKEWREKSVHKRKYYNSLLYNEGYIITFFFIFIRFVTESISIAESNIFEKEKEIDKIEYE